MPSSFIRAVYMEYKIIICGNGLVDTAMEAFHLTWHSERVCGDAVACIRRFP